ncbi:MAG: ParA family protein [Chloroflexi bacterium]|nr:ParA family protein [Chloroflexota bacterium]
MARHSKIIAVINQKGGVAKTTTVQHVGYCLAAQHGKRVLLLDLDPQANLSSAFGIEPDALNRAIFDVLKGDVPLSQIIKRVSDEYVLDVAPSNIELSRAELELIQEINSTYLLRSALTSPFTDDTGADDEGPYDYIIADCGPSLGILTVNALAAADYVLVPVQPEMYSLQGLKALEQIIDRVRTRANPALSVLGWVVTMHDGRTRVHKDVVELFRKNFGPALFDSIISINTTIREAQAANKTVFQRDQSKSGAQNYAALTDELLRRIGD